MLSFLVASSIQEALTRFMADVPLVQTTPIIDSRYNCLQCGDLQDGILQTRITQAPIVLVVHIKRYISINGESRKDLTNLHAFPTLLSLKSVSDGVVINHLYCLRASINHQGTVEAGHYWAFVEYSGHFYKCNDSKVSEANSGDLNNNTSYIIFFSRAE